MSMGMKLATHMLVDKKDRNIFAVVSETIEGLFDSRVVGFGIHNQEVLLCVRRLRDMLKASNSAYSTLKWIDGIPYSYTGQQ